MSESLRPPGHAILGQFEIPARDPDRAATFYRRAFGWRVEPVPWDGPPYFKMRPEASPEASHHPVGGGLGTPEAIGADLPLLMFHVDGGSLEMWLAHVEAAGGEAASPIKQVGTFGRLALIRDPEGNLLGLWSATPSKEAG